MNQTQNTEPNRCLKCHTEIEPQYYYCDSCADKRMKKQLAITILLSALILVAVSVIINILKYSFGLYLGGIPTALIYIATFALIKFIWDKFKYADSDLRDVPEETVAQTTKKVVKQSDEIILTAGIDVGYGKNTVSSTKPNGGFVYIYPKNSSEYQKIYIRKSKKVIFKSGDKIKLINCEINNKE